MLLLGQIQPILTCYLLIIVVLDHSDVRLQSRERVRGDFGSGPGNGSQKRRLACIWKANLVDDQQQMHKCITSTHSSPQHDQLLRRDYQSDMSDGSHLDCVRYLFAFGSVFCNFGTLIDVSSKVVISFTAGTAASSNKHGTFLLQISQNLPVGASKDCSKGHLHEST